MPKRASTLPRTAPSGPQAGPRGPPEGTQDGLRGPLDGPKKPPRRPRGPQDGPREPQEGPRGPRTAQESPKGPPDCPTGAPYSPKTAQVSSLRNPSEVQKKSATCDNLPLPLFASQAPLQAAAVRKKQTPGGSAKARGVQRRHRPAAALPRQAGKDRGQTSRVGTRGEPAPAPCAWHHGGRLPGTDDSVR